MRSLEYESTCDVGDLIQVGREFYGQMLNIGLPMNHMPKLIYDGATHPWWSRGFVLPSRRRRSRLRGGPLPLAFADKRALRARLRRFVWSCSFALFQVNIQDGFTAIA